MAASRDVKIAILGDARNFQKATQDASDSAGGFGKKLATVGKATAVALAATGVAAVAFGVKSAAVYKDVGAEVIKLQRYTGATAEAASRLRFASKMSGLDVGLLTKAMGQLSKNVTGTKLDKLNLGLKTATGKAKPLTAQLLILADRFKRMPAGAEKTALAMKLFGKAGADMLPFLDKGAKGIEELIKQSDALGNTLSGGDLDAIKESTKNQRLFAAGWEGVQIQIGRYVLPVLTKLMKVLVAGIGPAVTIVRKIMEKLSPVLKRVTDGFLLMVQWIAWAVIAFGKLKDGDVQWFAEIMDHMFGGEGKFVNFFEKVGDAVKFFGDKVRDALGWVKDNAGAILGGLAAAFSLFAGAQGIQAAAEGLLLFTEAVQSPFFWVALLVGALIYAYTHFEGFREGVNKIVEKVKEWGPVIKAWIEETLLPAFKKLTDFIADKVFPKFVEITDYIKNNEWVWKAIATTIGVVLVAAVVNLTIALAQAAAAMTLATWPFLLAIVVVAALAAAFWYLYQNNETFRKAIEKLPAVIDAVVLAAQALYAALWLAGFAAGTVIRQIKDLIVQLKDVPSVAGAAWSALSPFTPIGGLDLNPFDGRAMGGPVAAGTPYVVGERGPELFIPRSAGTIIPNNVASSGGRFVSAAGGGGNQTIVVKIGDEVVARVVANAMATGSRRGVG